jgi:hypothetical protein
MVDINETGTYKRHRRKRKRDLKKRKKKRRLERQKTMESYLEKLDKQ